ncbi:hypothetical protein [Thalassobacillus pellis]|uniref:hypothetical protein n=1 Tax=Thalassobacillus pellis TaxID=748008 RepID=UPI001961E210|nr:hypothetical protein [Thalassobacillus pellis]MBM7553100.1 hypothetical protein [Thalassobacillus pellis]
MRIILYEIGKLFNWKVIGLLFLLSFLFYQLFLSFHFEYFPNGRPAGDHFKITKQMIAKYGPEMNKKEYENFKKTYEKEVNKADKYVASQEEFANAGITTYEGFKKFDRPSNPELDNLKAEIIFKKEIDIFWELQARESIMERYEHFEERTLTNRYIDNEEWKKEYLNSESRHSILPDYVIANFSNLISMVGILIVLSVIIVVSRIHIIEYQNNAITLQYTTMEGRNLFKKKLVAAMVTATMITTVYLGIFFQLYAQNETSEFFASSLFSFEFNGHYWLDITFFQYIIASVVGVYLLSFVTAAISTYLSRVVWSYISLIGSQIPIAVVLILLIKEYLITRMFGMQYPVYLTIGTYIGLLLIGGAVLSFRWKKERIIDIV